MPGNLHRRGNRSFISELRIGEIKSELMLDVRCAMRTCVHGISMTRPNDERGTLGVLLEAGKTQNEEEKAERRGSGGGRRNNTEKKYEAIKQFSRSTNT